MHLLYGPTLLACSPRIDIVFTSLPPNLAESFQALGCIVVLVPLHHAHIISKNCHPNLQLEQENMENHLLPSKRNLTNTSHLKTKEPPLKFLQTFLALPLKGQPQKSYKLTEWLHSVLQLQKCNVSDMGHGNVKLFLLIEKHTKTKTKQNKKRYIKINIILKLSSVFSVIKQ